jgi:putative membrane protein
MATVPRRPAPQRPVLIELDGPAPSPAEAPPVPDPLPAGGGVQAAAQLATARPPVLTRAALWVSGSFLGGLLVLGAWNAIAGLAARNVVLGWALGALGLAAAVLLAALVLRELAGLARLHRIDRLRARLDAARTAPLAEARQATARLRDLYTGRDDLVWATSRLDDRRAEVLDADALVALTETELMAPLDAQARACVEQAARRVALATALIPLALADVATALWANLRMVRQVAQIYGGAPGTLGSWRLMRRVFGHLLATGAIALTDDMLSSVAGGGLVARLSRRMGEGVVNGALTARVGLAAMEVCRPMPFAALPRPSVSGTVGRALSGLWGRETATEGR